jgi:hypothetical protein
MKNANANRPPDCPVHFIRVLYCKRVSETGFTKTKPDRRSCTPYRAFVPTVLYGTHRPVLGRKTD